MKLSEVRRLLDCEVLCGDDQLEAEVDCCFAADMMSDVLAFSRAGSLLVTGLTSLQTVHTADIADMAAIVFIHDKRPVAPVVEVARQKKIPLLTTRRFMFETCGLLYDHGVRAARKE